MVVLRPTLLNSHARRPTSANAKKPPMTPPTMIPALEEDPLFVEVAATDGVMVDDVWVDAEGVVDAASTGEGGPVAWAPTPVAVKAGVGFTEVKA
jgi:hypothetical protein